MSRTLRAACAALLIGAALSGCYSYAPAGLPSIEPGSHVRAYLTPSAAQRVMQRDTAALSDPEHPVLRGTVVLVRPDGLALLVPVAVRDVAAGPQTVNRRVTLAASDIRTLELRRMDPTRTTVALGTGLVLGGLLLYLSAGN